MIKEILDEISLEPGDNKKMEILRRYKDNELLKRVLYLAMSGRVKFYIKQIPEYQYTGDDDGLEQALDKLSALSSREHTGGAASNHLAWILSSINPSDQQVIQRIIDKDLKIGMGRTNVNKVISGLIERTNYMGAISFNEKKINDIFKGNSEAISEIKADGRYCNITVMGGEVELTSRAGEETLISGGKFIDDLRTLSDGGDFVLNGELVIDGIKREISNGLMTSVIDISKKLRSEDESENKKAQKSIDNMLKRHGYVYSELLDRIRFITWDIIDIDDYFTNTSSVKRIDRLNRLISMLDSYKVEMISLVEYKFVKTYDEAIEHFSDALSREEEGTILKSLDGVWKHGKHNYQIKMKVEFDIDLKIVGFNYGGEGTKNENVISSVTCQSSCGKLEAKAQGIPEELMEFITENQDSLLGTIATVKCNGLSNNREGGNSVLYPYLKSLRDDKLDADSLEGCINIDAAAKGLKKVI